MRIAVVVLVVALTACGAHRAAPVGSSCGSLRAAYRRLPPSPPSYSPLAKRIGDAAGKACDTALASVHVGDGPRRVTAALGRPDRAPRCWLYRWPPGTGGADGARICFAAGRVARVQTAEHG